MIQALCPKLLLIALVLLIGIVIQKQMQTFADSVPDSEKGTGRGEDIAISNLNEIEPREQDSESPSSFFGDKITEFEKLTYKEKVLVGLVVFVVIFIAFCCVLFCLFESIRQIICCICCCSWCRDRQDPDYALETPAVDDHPEPELKNTNDED